MEGQRTSVRNNYLIGWSEHSGSRKKKRKGEREKEKEKERLVTGGWWAAGQLNGWSKTAKDEVMEIRWLINHPGPIAAPTPWVVPHTPQHGPKPEKTCSFWERIWSGLKLNCPTSDIAFVVFLLLAIVARLGAAVQEAHCSRCGQLSSCDLRIEACDRSWKLQLWTFPAGDRETAGPIF